MHMLFLNFMSVIVLNAAKFRKFRSPILCKVVQLHT